MSSEPRRLARAGILLLALGALREAAVPIAAGLAALLLGGGLDADALARTLGFAVLGTVAAAVGGIVMWRTTTYEVTPEVIRLRRGLLSVKETAVPLSRVQSVDTREGPLQRRLGVVEVQVQTAGGGRGAEIVLAAVTPAAAREVREAVDRGHPGPVAAPAAPTGPRRRLGARRLLAAALTAGQLGVILPVLAALSQVLDEVLLGDDARVGTELLPDTTGEWALTLAGLLLAAWLLSVAGAVVAFAGFTVRREGDRLRITRGLLARREATVAVPRVQAVRFVEGLLRRPFGLGTLRVEVAGYAAEAAAAQTLHPLVRRDEVAPLLAELLPELATRPDGLAPPPPRARRRYALPPALAGLALGAAGTVALDAWPLLALAPAGALAGWVRHREAGWRLGADGMLALRAQRLARTTVLAPVGRLQEHSVRETPWGRRAALADLAVAVGAGTRARVRHLDAGVAWALWERLRPRRAGAP